MRLAAAALALISGGAAGAQGVARPAAAPASVPAAPASNLTRTVVEDDAVRIEETRLRGAPLRITVQNKDSAAPPYEIQVAPPGRDPSQERGSAGRRTWSLFDF